jgi:hypothetical protein
LAKFVLTNQKLKKFVEGSYPAVKALDYTARSHISINRIIILPPICILHKISVTIIFSKINCLNIK